MLNEWEKYHGVCEFVRVLEDSEKWKVLVV